jgi:lipopolysaccharide export system permease protein
MAFGCLFFALLGCPAGLWASRADYLSIFAILFLPALFVYYPTLFMAGGYARDGKIPMAAGVWTANAVLALVAVVLSWRLIRR